MGGNVFKDGDSRPVTQRINQTDIITTVQWIERLTGIDFTQERDAAGIPVNYLGSTGRRPTSGDIDLAVDAAVYPKDQVYNRLYDWAKSQKLDPRDWIKRSGNSLHVKTPINGNPDLGFVQTDLMFITNLNWARWALHASGDSEYSGADRNIVINSIAKSLGWKLNQAQGIVDRATNKIVTDDPTKAAKLLLNNRATPEDLSSVETILAALEKDPNRDAKLATARDHFLKSGEPFVESVDAETEVNYMARLRDRIVNQGMWVLIEDQQIPESNIGGSAKGIEHLEDLIFRRGIRGVDDAKKILKAAADSANKSVSVKWDGRPAIVFGRKPDTGDFVLTDTSGFQARTYDGLFTSLRQLAQELERRDAKDRTRGLPGNRADTLIPLYQELWHKLEAAFPRGVRGYVQGDVLFHSLNPWREEAGNAVFQPNEVLYRIPLSSELGKKIAASDLGVAMHTMYADKDSGKVPLGDIKFKKVPGLMLEPPVYAESMHLDNAQLKAITALTKKYSTAINQLFNPTELRSEKITNLPALCIDFINSRVGHGFDNLAEGFLQWLPDKVTPSKLRNILHYLQSPGTNLEALAGAFEIWNQLHELKMSVLADLDLQHPGQEGWVMATPVGYAKAVNRKPGGFSARNRERNQPKPQELPG